MLRIAQNFIFGKHCSFNLSFQESMLITNSFFKTIKKCKLE